MPEIGVRTRLITKYNRNPPRFPAPMNATRMAKTAYRMIGSMDMLSKIDQLAQEELGQADLDQGVSLFKLGRFELSLEIFTHFINVEIKECAAGFKMLREDAPDSQGRCGS